jgi:K+-sensing histidine kinase KdpD
MHILLKILYTFCGLEDLNKLSEPSCVLLERDWIGRPTGLAVQPSRVNNAIKFTEERRLKGIGTINITTKNIDSQIHVSIKDTGTGIHSEILPRLFEKFASKSYQGTGLGLYICKSIVEAHGGRIWGENNPESKGGAIFTFSLPIGK